MSSLRASRHERHADPTGRSQRVHDGAQQPLLGFKVVRIPLARQAVLHGAQGGLRDLAGRILPPREPLGRERHPGRLVDGLGHPVDEGYGFFVR